MWLGVGCHHGGVSARASRVDNFIACRQRRYLYDPRRRAGRDGNGHNARNRQQYIHHRPCDGWHDFARSRQLTNTKGGNFNHVPLIIGDCAR